LEHFEKLLGLRPVPAPNLSKGFHPVLFEMLKEWAPRKELLLIAEPDAVIPAVKGYLDQEWEVECLGYEGSRGEAFDIDLNVPSTYDRQYAAVLSQSLLEHVCRPSIAIENMLNMTHTGGILVIHTVNPGCKYHAYPIDCVRFFPDFWHDLQKYLPFKLRWFRNEALNHFVAMEKL
jgi:hypothetical protein